MDRYDAVIVGGGPAGAVAGLVLARRGKRVVIVEKAEFPRFHIGESLLPYAFGLLKELGLVERLRGIPHVPKFGAEFGFGDDPATLLFDFDVALCLKDPETFNVERSLFDQMLLGAARDAGAEVRRGTVKEVVKLEDENVVLRLEDGEISGRYLLDASGQNTLVGRHLGTRRTFAEKHLQKVAHFAHMENVARRPGREGGHPLIVMCEEGWFWSIPLDEKRTSVGLVMDAGLAKQTGVAPTRLLAWGIERCPVLREKCAKAQRPEMNQVLSDFSYTCRPYAGAGHFLIGDAAAFLDPIFSTGATLAMASGKKAAELVNQVLEGRSGAEAARAEYVEFFARGSRPFWEMIRGYYHHSFRELFMNGSGPLQMHRAVIDILAGNAFPRPAWAVRWRLAAFHACVRINEYLPLVKRRKRFSLMGP